jgi:hypothetical protein
MSFPNVKDSYLKFYYFFSLTKGLGQLELVCLHAWQIRVVRLIGIHLFLGKGIHTSMHNLLSWPPFTNNVCSTIHILAINTCQCDFFSEFLCALTHFKLFVLLQLDFHCVYFPPSSMKWTHYRPFFFSSCNIWVLNIITSWEQPFSLTSQMCNLHINDWFFRCKWLLSIVDVTCDFL